MKLYVWEGNGISDAYHDDGTLIVLAESPEQARDIVRAGRAAIDAKAAAWGTRVDILMAEGMGRLDAIRAASESGAPPNLYEAGVWDGRQEALDREPDRTIELDVPCVVAFNGGGYD